MVKFTKFTKEELAYYNSSDISQVANSIGITLNGRIDSKGWQRSIDSTGKPMTKLAFHVASNTYHNFETAKTDRPIGFLMDWKGWGFQEAVNYLKENDFSKMTGTPVYQNKNIEREKFKYPFSISQDKSNLKNYLINERKISAGLVNKLLQVRLIEQDTRKNILFHYKKDAEIVGAAIQGTFISYNKYEKRGTFKGIAENSEPNFGFHFSFGEPTRLYVFEAPIDAMSHYTLKPEDRRDIMYGVETGFSKETVNNFIRYAKSKGNENIVKDGIYISVDNDAAGIKYWSHFAEQNQHYEGTPFHNNIPDFYSVPRNVVEMYQSALSKYNGESLNIRPLLALHKFETNFELSTKIANSQGYARYFGEKGEARDITLKEQKERIDSLVKNYVFYKGDLRKTITNPTENHHKNSTFEGLIRDLSDTYETRLVIKNKDEIQKDWNGVLQRRVQMLNQPFINVSSDKQLESALQEFDYNQIASQDLKAAGIHNRQAAHDYEEAHEPELG
jgi:hypothetical protein